MLNGAAEHDSETEPETELGLDGAGPSADFRAVEEAARLSGLGKRFIVTLGQQGSIRREGGKHGGWRYSLTDCVAYREGAPKPEAATYESELKTLVTGYKDLLALATNQVKQAQQHERELFTAFSAPLKALVEGLQAQSVQLVERANAGDKARLDFLIATETMLKEQRAEQADTERAKRLADLRMNMWGDVKKAAPHIWNQIQETLGVDASKLERLKAGQELAEKLDKEKVAALFAFNFLSDEEKTLLCKAFGYDRIELETMVQDAGAREAASEEAPATEPATEAPSDDV